MSGGLAKGAYQLGVLKAVEEIVDFKNIAMISASSVGVLNAYAFVNHQLSAAESIWKSVNCKSTSSFIRNILQSDFLDNHINKISLSSDFEKIDFYATLLNTNSRDINYINLKNSSPEFRNKFVRASVALPPFNNPVNILGNGYVDGALVDNIPIGTLIGKELDCIICIYFEDYNYDFENYDINAKTIKINHQSDMFMKNVFLFKHEYIEKMICEGYGYGRSVLQNFFVNGNLMPSFKDTIADFNMKNSNLKWYVTCEVVTKRLNKVIKKYLDRNK